MNKILFFIALITFMACDSLQNEADVHIPEGLNRRDEMRFKQYMVQGKKIYLSQCSACHKPDGSGLKKLYPPLAKADFLAKNLDLSICMVQNGYKEPINVNGVEYNMIMPAFEKLSPLEIAEVMTYISNKWGNQIGFIEVNQVQKAIQNCQ